MASHHQRLIAALASCSAAQRAAFLARVVRRATQALVACRPADSTALALRRCVDDILARLPAADSEPLGRVAEQLLLVSASPDGDGEARDRVGFYTAAAALILSAALTGRLADPAEAALCASQAVHVQEQVYDDDEAVRGLERGWQSRALLGDGGPLEAAAILALPDFDPGPVYRGGPR